MASDTSLEYRFSVAQADDEKYVHALSDMTESAINPTSFACEAGAAPYCGRFRMQTCGDLGLLELECSAPAGSGTLFKGERARSHIARNRSFDVHLLVWLEGTTRLSSYGRTDDMRPGDFTIVSNESAFSARSLDRLHVCNLALPAAWDRIGDTRLEDIFGSIHRGSARKGTGMVDFARHLLSRADALSTAGASRDLYDVLALALTPEAKDAHPAGLLAMIRNHVDVHCTDPDLPPDAVAAIFGISVRHLHRLFAASGTSFTEYVIEQRLLKARALLTDPRHRQRKISDLAADCGFRNANHFGSRFRARYGMTPSELRDAPFFDV